MNPEPSHLGITYLNGRFYRLELNQSTKLISLGAPIRSSCISLNGLKLELDSSSGEAIYGHPDACCRIWDMKKHEALLFNGIVRTHNLLDVLLPVSAQAPLTCH